MNMAKSTPQTAGLPVVILCGGQGTRLREETEFRPKPLVEIGGRPILWHIMKHYAHHGMQNFVLALGYKGGMIRDYVLNYHNNCHDLRVDMGKGTVSQVDAMEDHVDWRVVLSDTGTESLTGRRIKRVLRYIESDTFLATYGDGVSNVDIGAVLELHRKTGKLATVTAVHPSSRFGELGLDGELVRRFREKPQVTDGWINGGFFVFEKRAFDLIDDSENFALEDGLLEKLADAGEVAVHRHDGFWQCMDTFREMQLLNTMWNDGRAPWKTW